MQAKFFFTFRHELDPQFAAVLQSLISTVGDVLMSKFTDSLKKIDEKLDKALGRVDEDVTKLRAQLAELQTKVDEGVQTPEDEALLEQIEGKLDALDPTKEDTIPAEPTETPAPEG